MCRNAGKQRPGVFSAQNSPRRGALLDHPPGQVHGGRQVGGKRTLVADKQTDHIARIRDQRAKQVLPVRAVLQTGAGAVQVVVSQSGPTSRQRVGVGNLRNCQPHAAGGEVEFGEKR